MSQSSTPSRSSFPSSGRTGSAAGLLVPHQIFLCPPGSLSEEHRPNPGPADHACRFSVVDRSTCWPAAFPIRETSAETCIAALAKGISSFRVPARLTSNSGFQFTSSAWSAFCCFLGIDHIMTMAYHLQSNGVVERRHRRLKAMLVARSSSSSWPSELPWVLIGLRSVPLEASGVSSAELVYSATASMLGQFLFPPELTSDKFLDELHCLVDQFVPPPLVYCSSPPFAKVHLLPSL